MIETSVQVDDDALRIGRVLRLTGLPFVISFVAMAPLHFNPLYFN